ncbi:sensor histidine kinase [Acetobacterium bakii]|uniref:histidine kinase n=1 Tax=Acetobacterium bakii TaxID=52689 RepID=A0A0L6U109_9FIRM|nr:HAMP domain-containing sensor histidine kinase [Acetobacterium bakii]KNZ42194.1 hypothetical protein AKG39_07825 [Acetobacterium bakii]
MATKLKNIWTDQGLKITVISLAVIFSILCFGTLFKGIEIMDGVTPDTENYLASSELNDKVSSAYYDILQRYDYYLSEENISAGNTVTDDRLIEFKEDLAMSSDFASAVENEERTLAEVIGDPLFLDKFSSEIEARKLQYINADLKKINLYEGQIQQIPGLTYYVESQGIIKAFPEKVTQADVLDNRVVFSYDNGLITSTLPKINQYAFDDAQGENFKVSLSFDDDYIAEQEGIYQNKRAEFQLTVSLFILFFLGTLISAVLACISAGHKKGTVGITLLKSDSFYIDLHLFVLLIVEGLLLSGMIFIYAKSLPLIIMLLIFGVGALLGLNFLLSLTRIIKDRSFAQHLLSWKIIMRIHQSIKKIINKCLGYYHEVMKGSSSVKRFMGFSIGLVILGLAINVPLIGIFSLGLIVYILYVMGKKVRKYDEIIQGLERIKNGEVDYKLTGFNGALGELAEGINAIGEGITLAVSKEVQSQRMKTELLTNVSHDIRTPLTSIITSIDLLKNGQLNPTEKVKYLNILENKAQRLKTLTDDLFEAAKASSGNIEVNFEAVDLEILMTQGLGEMEEELGSSQLEFITQYPKQLLVVNADGRLLWRVIQNLLSNILKYAQKESRVYVELIKKEGMGIIIFKNISAEPLNISPEELVERFKRGDETRNSEGSGLGLAIAKDLMVIQKGELKIDIDGDLFKAALVLSLAE